MRVSINGSNASFEYNKVGNLYIVIPPLSSYEKEKICELHKFLIIKFLLHLHLEEI